MSGLRTLHFWGWASLTAVSAVWISGCRPQSSPAAPQNGVTQVQSTAQRTVETIPVSLDASPNAQPGPIAEATARIEPAVVTIDTEYRPIRRYGDLNGMMQEEEGQGGRGSGSGVIINADGYIVTNNHVIKGASKILVTTQDKRRMEGRVIGADASSDLAVVKVEQKNLPVATLADSDKVKVGEWVIAVGNPLGVGTTVTAGIVSAMREFPDGSPYKSVIQTDAAINRGNSGGALADIKGRLIGINSFILSPSGGSIGLGFAIPSNTMRTVIGELIAKGHIARPYLGVAFGNLDESAKDYFSIPGDVSGAFVSQVLQGSPAAAAGIRPYDVIRKANGKAIVRAEDFSSLIQNLKIGDKLDLVVWRQGHEGKTSAQLQERPNTPEQ